MTSKHAKPPALPLLISVVGIVFSMAILVLSPLRQSPAIYFGYLFTPFLPIFMLGWLRSKDAAGRQQSMYDLAKAKSYLRFGALLSSLGFAVSLFVILQIALRLSQI